MICPVKNGKQSKIVVNHLFPSFFLLYQYIRYGCFAHIICAYRLVVTYHALRFTSQCNVGLQVYWMDQEWDLFTLRISRLQDHGFVFGSPPYFPLIALLDRCITLI